MFFMQIFPFFVSLTSAPGTLVNKTHKYIKTLETSFFSSQNMLIKIDRWIKTWQHNLHEPELT